MPTNQTFKITPNGSTATIPTVSGVVGQAGYPAANPPIKGATAPYWAYGSGVPTYSPPIGSMYTNTSAAAVSMVLYVYTAAKTWQGVV